MTGKGTFWRGVAGFGGLGKRGVWLGILLGLALSAGTPAAQAQRDTDDDDAFARVEKLRLKRPGWFHSAKRKTPEAQFEYAERQQARGRDRRARRAYNALVHNWHHDPLAAEAQYRYAQGLAKANKHAEAFEAFQYLIRYFSGAYSHQETLETMMELANAVRTARYADILFLPGFQDPGRAVPLYEEIVRSGPNWERAPEAQFYAAAIQEADKDFELAVVSYETLLMRYPRSAYVPEAAYRRAHCLYEISRRHRRDEDQCREALAAMLAFVRQYPDDERVTEARATADRLRQRLSEMYYDRALYYDRIAKKPKAAIIAYTDFVQMFPTSEQRPEADARLAALQLEMESNHEP